jgi:hypothetical protein
VGDTLKKIGHEFQIGDVNTPVSTPDMNLGGVTIPGQQTMVGRPSFISAFLQNLQYAIPDALKYSQVPGGGAATGLAGVFQGAEDRRLQQQKTAQTTFLNDLASRRENREQQSFQTDEALKGLNLQRQKDLTSFASNPQALDQVLTPMSASLTNLIPAEKAQLDSARIAVETNLRLGKLDVSPYNTAIAKISQDRITEQNGKDSSPFKAWKTQFIAEKGRGPDSKEIQAFQNSGQAMKIEGLQNLRQDNYLDTTTGTVETKTAGEFAQDNKSEPGRYLKFSGQIANSLKGQSLINDIRDGIKQMRSAVNAPDFQLSSGARALMSLASKNPDTAVGTVMTGLASQKLSEAEQNYLIAHATLVERSMSLRGLQGQGAGSDEQRRAIVAMLPSLVTADKKMAEKQLKTLENNVDNVASSIPKLGKRPQAPAKVGDPLGIR